MYNLLTLFIFKSRDIYLQDYFVRLSLAAFYYFDIQFDSWTKSGSHLLRYCQ